MTMPTPEGARSIQRVLRRGVIFGLLAAVAWFVWRYDFYVIPDDYPHLTPQHAPAGSRIVLMDDDPDDPLSAGSIVAYRPAGSDALCFGVVIGVPGDSIAWEPVRAGVSRLVVGDHREELATGSGRDLRPFRLAAGEYYVLNGDRAFGEAARHPDSRVFGPIPRERIEKRVAPTFFFR